MELLGFLVIAWLITRSKVWGTGFHLRDHFSIKTLIHSALDEGPIHIKPGHYDKPDRTGSQDPNSNPHYIWNEED